MGKVVKKNQPCIDPSCGSSDALQIYEDGDAFCFSCQKFFTKAQVAKGLEDNNEVDADDEPDPDAEDGEAFKATTTAKAKTSSVPSFSRKTLSHAEIADLPIRGFKERLIKKEVAEFFGVHVSYGGNGQIDAHYYPYEDGKHYKIRKLPKEFTWIGMSHSLFGKERFAAGGKRLIITEGEIDAMSVAQANLDKYSRIYPVVALSSAAMAHKTLLLEREWVRTFTEVILMFDEDEAGQKAVTEAVKIIGPDKVRIAKLPCKDPDLTYREKGGNVLMQCMFDAQKYIPAGIVEKTAIWKALSNYNSAPVVPYPPCLAGVNSKLKGKRGGEITLFISGTGSGKSTILREDILHVLETTDHMVGIVSLEESPAETARKLSGMAINRNPAEEEIPLEELKEGFDKVFGADRVVLLDHQGSINDTSIVDHLEYMCLLGCKELYIDHITILVSEGVGDLTGNEAQDKVMNDLLRLVKRYPDVWIGLVSHLRKAPNNKTSFEEGRLPSLDDIRGSGSIKQISFDIVAFARNLSAESEIERNTIMMAVLKARYTGLTGPVAGARYDRKTGRLAAEGFMNEYVSLQE